MQSQLMEGELREGSIKLSFFSYLFLTDVDTNLSQLTAEGAF